MIRHRGRFRTFGHTCRSLLTNNDTPSCVWHHRCLGEDSSRHGHQVAENSPVIAVKEATVLFTVYRIGRIEVQYQRCSGDELIEQHFVQRQSPIRVKTA